jgi:hypothetical protein
MTPNENSVIMASEDLYDTLLQRPPAFLLQTPNSALPEWHTAHSRRLFESMEGFKRAVEAYRKGRAVDKQ